MTICHHYYLAPDCPNCGEQDEMHAGKGARISSSAWGHDFACCSDACGKRLGHKLRSGMVALGAIDQAVFRRGTNPYDRPGETRIADLRLRIKVLENKLKRTP